MKKRTPEILFIVILSIFTLTMLTGCPSRVLPSHYYNTPEYVYVTSMRGDNLYLHVQSISTQLLKTGEKRSYDFERTEAPSELYDILSAAADEGVSYEMYGDRILMTDTNLNANAVIMCYQVTENATRHIPVRADDGTLAYTNYSGNVYHYTAYNMGMWLGNAFIMAPWHLTDIEAAESESFAEFVIPDLRENVSYPAEGDIEEWAEFYRFNGYTAEVNGDILAVTDPDPSTLSAAVYGERNLTRPDKIEFTVTFERGSVVFCGGSSRFSTQ